jgi:hypothetical protein
MSAFLSFLPNGRGYQLAGQPPTLTRPSMVVSFRYARLSLRSQR